MIQKWKSRRELKIKDIVDQIEIQPPIDIYDFCQYYKNDELHLFNVSMLKAIWEHFEIPFKSRDCKSDLILKVREMISVRQCCSIIDE